MPKDLSTMNHQERMNALLAERESPASVARADELLNLIMNEWLDVRAMRDRVAARHGDKSSPPKAPRLEEQTSVTVSAQPDQTSAVVATDGIVTLTDLANRYRAGERYLATRYKTRVQYDTLINIILADYPAKRLAELDTDGLRAVHQDWKERRGPSIAKSLITMIRSMANYVSSFDKNADALAITLHRMHFPVPPPRSEELTAEQATAVRLKLRDMGFRSMALAQALQYDLMLRQVDCIGQWVPITEPGESKVTYGDQKWVRGIRWEEIDGNYVLRHRTIDNKGQDVDLQPIDLKQSDAVMEELKRIERRESGAVIVSENTGLPWVASQFRIQWRKAADICGIPKDVRNTDGRATANNEYRRKHLRAELRLVAKSN